MIRAGQKRHSVIIQKRTDSRGVTGEVVPSWSTYKTRRFEVRRLSDDERFSAMREEATATHSFDGRYTSGVTPLHRLSFDSRTFDIVAVNNIGERNRRLEIKAREVVA